MPTRCDRSENPFGAITILHQSLIDQAARYMETSYSLSGVHISMADAVALGSFLALYACGGPAIPFQPGRVDAAGPNKADLLPSM